MFFIFCFISIIGIHYYFLNFYIVLFIFNFITIIFKDCNAALSIASKKGKFEILKFLIENAADVNMKDEVFFKKLFLFIIFYSYIYIYITKS
jgi:hypothetical protein